MQYTADKFFELLKKGAKENSDKQYSLDESVLPFHFIIDSLLQNKMQKLPAGRYVVYGAGSVARKVLPSIRAYSDIEIVGFIDQDFKKIKSHCGVPVHDPRAAKSMECDYFLPLHPQAENLMSEILIANNVPSQKIIRLSKMILADWSVDDWMDEHLGQYKKEIKTLVISSLRPEWSVLPQAAWPGLIDSESMLHIGFYPHEYDMHSYKVSGIDGLNLFPSGSSILKIIGEACPQKIFLRVSPHSKSEHLVATIKKNYPDVKICVEFYDMGIMFSRRYLLGEIGFSEAEYSSMLSGTQVAFDEADFLLTKSAGSLWQEIIEHRNGQSHTYYPVVSKNGSRVVKRQSNQPVQVVYAGSVRAKELIDGPETTPGENFFKYFHIMAESGQVKVDIFNAQHKNKAEDQSVNNSLLMERYGNEKGLIRYHRALSLEALTRKLPEYDFGFACAHYEGDYVEGVSRAALGNRFMGYVEAGVPILVDTYFEAMAELVERFNAGVVIEPGDIKQVPELLCSADRKKLQQGVFEMKNWMLEQNGSVLKELHNFFKEM